jgi:hypothetical protein
LVFLPTIKAHWTAAGLGPTSELGQKTDLEDMSAAQSGHSPNCRPSRIIDFKTGMLASKKRLTAGNDMHTIPPGVKLADARV